MDCWRIIILTALLFNLSNCAKIELNQKYSKGTIELELLQDSSFYLKGDVEYGGKLIKENGNYFLKPNLLLPVEFETRVCNFEGIENDSFLLVFSNIKMSSMMSIRTYNRIIPLNRLKVKLSKEEVSNTIYIESPCKKSEFDLRNLNLESNCLNIEVIDSSYLDCFKSNSNLIKTLSIKFNKHSVKIGKLKLRKK